MNRRVDLKSILADPELRRELIIGALIATQAREGRDLTWEEAADVYDRVSGLYDFCACKGCPNHTQPVRPDLGCSSSDGKPLCYWCHQKGCYEQLSALREVISDYLTGL